MKKTIDVCDVCGEERFTPVGSKYSGGYNPYCKIHSIFSDEWNDTAVNRAISMCHSPSLNQMFGVNEGSPRDGQTVLAYAHPIKDCVSNLTRYENGKFMDGEQVIDAEYWEKVLLVEEL